MADETTLAVENRDEPDGGSKQTLREQCLEVLLGKPGDWLTVECVALELELHADPGERYSDAAVGQALADLAQDQAILSDYDGDTIYSALTEPENALVLAAEAAFATPLSDEERAALAEAEAVVEAAVRSFLDAGRALRAIRDAKLYRAGYETFENYLKDRWGLGNSRGYQLIAAADVVDNLRTLAPPEASTDVEEGAPAPVVMPQNEAQCRPLDGLPLELQRETWQRVNKTVQAGAKLTAAVVEQERDSILRGRALDYLEAAGEPRGLTEISEAVGVWVPYMLMHGLLYEERVQRGIEYDTYAPLSWVRPPEPKQEPREAAPPPPPFVPGPDDPVWYSGAYVPRHLAERLLRMAGLEPPQTKNYAYGSAEGKAIDSYLPRILELGIAALEAEAQQPAGEVIEASFEPEGDPASHDCADSSCGPDEYAPLEEVPPCPVVDGEGTDDAGE